MEEIEIVCLDRIGNEDLERRKRLWERDVERRDGLGWYSWVHASPERGREQVQKHGACWVYAISAGDDGM